MKLLKISVFVLVLLSFALVANAAVFSGYTYNTTENPINNTNVTIETYTDSGNGPQLQATFSNVSNASGYWILDIPDAQLTGKMLKFIPRKYNSDRKNWVEKIGATLPPFNYAEITSMLNISAINFYLKEAATINVTAVNETNGDINFTYMLKDTKLGFDVNSDWQNRVFQKTLYLPADRNYSIEIFPNQQMPVFYNINNLSDYTSPKKVDIIFNVTTRSSRVTGRFNLSNGTGVFDEMNIVNYLLEPGNMVFTGMPMPYNMSSWFGGTDKYNTTSGTYNVTLPATAMSSKILMLAIGKSGGQYYAGFRNISPTIGGGDIENFNFILYRLLGNGSTITANTATGGQQSINLNQTTFVFINSTGDAQTTATGHMEVEVQYSNLGSTMPDFTFMEDVDSTEGGTFNLPLLDYAVKKVVLYSQNYAPRKTPYTATQLNVSQVNITLTQFNPGGIDSDFSGIEMRLIRSSAECDISNFPSSCRIGGGMGTAQDEDNFKPLNALISGGAVSMIIMKDNVMVHYVNVDMLASGPPDALFDNASSSTTSGTSLQEAWRFGSLGPEIYDSLIVAFPYSSTLDDSQDINVSLPYLYDNDWNLLWNTTKNGTGGVTTNLTDYADYNTSWFSGMNCSKTDSSANCFVNTSTNIIWMKLPHFSGVGPTTSGRSSSSSGSSSSSTGGGGGGAAGNVYPVVLSQTKATSFGLAKDDKARFTFLGKTHYITAIKVSLDEATIRIESSPVEVTLKSGQEVKVNLDDDSYNDIYIKLDKTSSSGKRAYFIVKEIHEAIKKVTPIPPIPKEEEVKVEEPVEEKAEESLASEEKEEIPPHAVVPLKKKTYNLIFSVLGAVLVALIVFALIIKRKEH